MKVFLHTIGCRLNQSEIETMGRQLLAAGHDLVDEAAQADKVIINTCAVTAEAAHIFELSDETFIYLPMIINP